MRPPPLPDYAPPQRRWIVPALILALVCLPVVAMFGWFLHFRSSGASAVQRLEAQIRERGEPLTLTELAATYPSPPDQDNGAVALLNLWEQEAPAYWAAFREGKTTLPSRPPTRYAKALPFLGSGAGHISRTASLPPASVAAATAYLKAHKAHIEAVRAVLREYSQFRFPIQLTNGVMTLLPHLSKLRWEAENFRIHGLMAAERGDVDGAINDLEAEARVGETLAKEPVLISQLVRMACNQMVLEDMERLLSRRSLSDRQLEKLETLVDRLEMKGALRMSLVAERAFDLNVLSFSPKVLARMSSSSDGGSDESDAAGYRVWRDIMSATGWKDADTLLTLNTLGKVITLADRDDSEAITEAEQVIHQATIAARRFPPKLVSAMLLPALAGLPAKFAAYEGERRAAVVGLAIECYRTDHQGRLPERLEDLEPKFLSGIPKDPFDGAPIRFHPLPSGFVTYSIGADRVDDGGRERLPRSSDQHFDETFVVAR